MRMSLVHCLIDGFCQQPIRPIGAREEGVSFELVVDEGKIEVGGQGKRLFEHLTAAEDENFWCFLEAVEGLRDAACRRIG